MSVQDFNSPVRGRSAPHSACSVCRRRCQQSNRMSAVGHFATLWGLAMHVRSTPVNGRFCPATRKASGVPPLAAVICRRSRRGKSASCCHSTNLAHIVPFGLKKGSTSAECPTQANFPYSLWRCISFTVHTTCSLLTLFPVDGAKD